MLKDNEYFKDLYENCVGKEISHGLGLILSSWKMCGDCEDLIVKDRFDRLDVYDVMEFNRRLRASGIKKFTIHMNSISPEALFHYIYWNGTRYLITANLMTGNWSQGQRNGCFYQISIL